jgi:radical SAM superfamily enzyme YgiQ (UPF0313 family)
MINTFQHTNRYRMRSPAKVVDEIEMLHRVHGVETFKIIDELFVLNRTHYRAICQGIIDRGLGPHLNIWGYARTDSVAPGDLPLMREAGIRWLALGIEAGDAAVRAGANKALRGDRAVPGSENLEIAQIVGAIHDAGMHVIANYIFGLRDDDLASMQLTLDLAQYLNTEWANFNSSMAYPGSALYDEALREGWTLPESWAGYSQHNRHTRPLDTKHICGAEVLRFRDEAFRTYFSDPRYLAMIRRKFGEAAVAHINQMLEYRLERDLLR